MAEQATLKTPFATLYAGLDGAPLPYLQGLDLQEEAVARIERASDRGTILLLEHEAVYTAGRRALEAEYPTDGTPVVPVNRGGKVTWHGPGQLVAYPVIRLREQLHAVELVRALEGVIIDTLANFDIEGYRIDGRAGVWVQPTLGAPEKIAQIGLHTRAGIVTHGIAINCNNSLAPFTSFVPCGISDAGVTTITRRLGRTVTPREVAPVLLAHMIPAIEGAAA